MNWIRFERTRWLYANGLIFESVFLLFFQVVIVFVLRWGQRENVSSLVT